MIFKTLKITEGMYQRVIDFSNHVNLIYSAQNSSGKTTLLRLLLYSIGYPIPSTKKIKFERCATEVIISFHDDVMKIIRYKDYLEVTTGELKEHYILPTDADVFHAKIFGTNNTDVLNNILGAIYVDQEKGWTLLNRGIVIGKIRFNIEQLVRGLANRNTHDLQIKLQKIETELKKYKQMFNLSEYQKEINEAQDNIIYDSYDEKIDNEIETLQMQRRVESQELKRLNDVIHDNSTFKKYIERMKIYVIGSGGEQIPVNAGTIVGYNDNIEFLLAKRRILSNRIRKIDFQIEQLSSNISQEQTLFKTESLIQSFDQKISQMKIDSISVKKVIEELEKDKKAINQALTQETKYNNNIVTDIHNTIMKYANELGFEEYINPASDYIFTDDLKSLSGAILHMIIFTFKLAYIEAIQRAIGMKLPIILDSPSGREVVRETIDKMIKILKRDFSQNQIIIASIYMYEFEDFNQITLKETLIDEPIPS